tara:strand:+ start:1978 stop:2520 length:543 start_codon:yes stop_codon:yes gene_type:complete
MSKIIVQNVRCSYVFVTSPRKNEDGTDGKYSVQLIIPKDHPQLKKIKNEQLKTLKEKFGEKVKPSMFKLPLRDGDEERDSVEYENCYFINANGGRKPGIANRNNEPADQDDIEEYCYSGAVFHVSINFYAFEKDGNKGVAVGLNNIMLRKKGERLDGSAAATDEFSEFADNNDDDEDIDF